MRYRDLPNRHSGSYGPDLHLKRPAPVPIIHLKVAKALERHSPKRTHVSEPVTEKHMGKTQYQAIPKSGMGVGVSFPSRLRSPDPHDQIRSFFQSGNERGNMRNIFGMIRIQEDHESRRRLGCTKGSKAFKTGGSIPPLILLQDRRTCFTGHDRGPIGRPIVHNQHRVELGDRKCREENRERLFLIERWDQDSGLRKHAGSPPALSPI